MRSRRLLVAGLFLLLALPGLAARGATLAELAARNDIAAIARLGPAALPELARLYQAGSDEQKIRIAGIFNSLGQSSRAAELALLADAHTPNVELRVAVQYALGRVSDDPQVVDTLLAILRNDANPIFRDHAGCALANDQVHLTERKRLRLYEGLIGTLSHPKRRVQNTAIAALEHRGVEAMAGPVPRKPVAPALLLLAALLAIPCAGHAAAEPFLVRYSFDDGLVATGPDTFTVYRYAKGSVQLSTAFHVSGYRSLEIRDVVGDGDFPELQGYFPERRDGRLFLHFALLVTDPGQELNAVLAGPGGFHPGKDGIAFWLTVREGVLRQVSDSIPKRLLPLKAFTWYAIDVDYDVARGVYDLRVAEEGQKEPAISLQEQPNAAALAGTAVNVFSFIGDLADRSNVDYFVDDFVLGSLGSDAGAARPAFVAPGRRKFFVDSYTEEASELHRLRKPGSPLSCPPVLALDEVGLSPRDLLEARAAGRLEALAALLSTGPAAGRAFTAPRLAPVWLWKTGCAALAGGRAAEALAAFETAARQSPQAPLFGLSRLLALTALKRLNEADDLLVDLHARWRDDPRYALASALLALQRQSPNGGADEARSWLDPAALETLRGEIPVARLAGGDWSPGVLAALQSADPAGWKRWRATALAAEQSFYLALLDGRPDEARDFALQIARRLAAVQAPAGEWLERAGDAAFARRELDEARQLYGQARAAGAPERSVLLKLSDVAFLLGDLATEKALRERYYGSLDPKPASP
jgi:hypothetical protein